MSTIRIRGRSPASMMALVFSMLLFGSLAGAQSPAPVHADLGLVVNGRIDAIARQPGGGVVFGGSFTSVNGVPRKNIARLQPNGTLDPAWNPGADNLVSALAVDADGDIYAGGSFFVIAGESRNALAKLLGTGTGAVDPSWNHNGGVGGHVSAIVVGADESIFVAGSFSYFEGVIRAGVGKLLPNGNPDAAWNPASPGYISDLALDDANGHLYVGGAFNYIGTQNRSGLARLSTTGTGETDETWNPSTTNLSYVRAIALDGASVYVGGTFVAMGGAPRTNLARLSKAGNGNADPDWNPGADDEVSTLTLGNDGALYAGGNFTTIGGVSRNRIARLASNGSGAADASFNWPLDSVVPDQAGPFVRIYSIAVDVDGTVFAGGEFTSIGGLPRMGLAALDASAPIVDAERSGEAKALARTPDGGMIVGGYFLKAQGVSRRNLLRVEPDGSLDPDWNPQAYGVIESLAVDADGAVYAGGQYAQIGGAARTRLAKLDATTGQALPGFDPAPNGDVLALALDGSGHLFAGGSFTTMGGQARNRVAKLATSSGALDPWDPSADAPVRAMAISDGDVYLGGDFNFLGTSFRRYIGRTAAIGTGVPDSWQPGANNRVMSLAIGVDGVYVGGQFSNIGSASRSYVAKLSRTAPGLADALWNPQSNSMVRGLAVDGNVVYATGDFQTIGGQSRTTLARLLADGTADPAWNPSPNWSYGFAVALDGGNSVYVAGSFVTVGAQVRQGVAAIPLEKSAQAALFATATPASIGVGGTSTLGTSGGSGGGIVTYTVTSGAASCSISGSTLTGLAAGNCTVTASKQGDGQFVGTSASVNLVVLQANQAPTLALAADRFHAAGSAGAHSVPDFASSHPGAGEAAQAITFQVTTLSDGNDVVNGVAIDAAGTLHYTLTGNTGAALLRVLAQDDGGTAGGGHDTSPAREFRIIVGDGANIVLDITRTLPQAKGALKLGALVEYAVAVHNNGPQAVAGLIVRIPAPRGLADVLWSCTAPGPACAPASGATSVITAIDLQPGQTATIALTGRIVDAENFVELRASVQMPAGVVLLSTGEENRSFVEASNATGIFRFGFE